ncbi:MAG: endonuclease VIII [Dehalococcoidia bacterium]|nr:endonuclease VIII [Dehalococcoidia bacterium]
MLEIPEAAVLAAQCNEALAGKKICNVVAGQSPHKFAWYCGDPQRYGSFLTGKTITETRSYGGLVEITAGDAKLLFGDGVNLRYYTESERLPARHQLLLEFDDGSSLVGSVQMYGGLWAFREGEFDSKYYLIARTRPSPLSAGFDRAYFSSLFEESPARLSLKAFLATEQRIPGLGNGVLQDILFNAGMHPRKKRDPLSAEDQQLLFDSIKSTLSEMTAQGGRDTEHDLWGRPGGYRTRLSKNTVGRPCSVCGTPIKKEAYLGGSVYYCDKCQTM